MTVANNYHKVSYVGNGLTTDFSFDFPILETSSIKVYVSIDGEETEVDSSKYAVNVSSNGGSVTFKTAPVADSIIAIIRLTDQTQETPYKTSSGFPAVRVEEALDKLTMMAQEQQEVIDRCLKVIPTNGQKPQELLDEVYARLDSSIEIAANAQKAADDASAAVENAEALLDGTTEYVNNSKAEIATLKAETIEEVEGISASAITSVTTTSQNAINTINTTVETAEGELDTTIRTAIVEAKAEVKAEADKAIEGAAETATQRAEVKLNNYLDTTTIPSLSGYVSAAQTAATNASNSETNALTYKNNASESATTAQTSADRAVSAAAKIPEPSGNNTALVYKDNIVQWGQAGADIPSMTLAEYNDIPTKDPKQYYAITDDTDTGTDILQMIYPVGSVFETSNPTCPLANLFGTWVQEPNIVNDNFVIETYIDGANGYRIWNDGWCEQWGYFPKTSSYGMQTITFIKTYKNTDYNLITTVGGFDSTTTIQFVHIGAFNKTVSSFQTKNDDSFDKTWKASGYLATDQYTHINVPTYNIFRRIA